jgi:hypothetical protein
MSGEIEMDDLDEATKKRLQDLLDHMREAVVYLERLVQGPEPGILDDDDGPVPTIGPVITEPPF